MAQTTSERTIGVAVEPSERDGQSNGAQDGADGARPPASATEATVPAARRISRGRSWGPNVLISLTTVLLVVGMFAIWANRLLFNPDNWSNASTQLLQHPEVRSGTANYLVDQLYANVDVAGLLRSGLPTQLQALAAPAAGALRNGAVQGAELALARPRVQNLWARANRAADRAFIAIVHGGKGPVRVNQGAVTLNLGPILDDVASRLGLPSNLSAKLPANVANLTVFRSDQLRFVQNAGNAIQALALWLTILVPMLYALALALAGGVRRRTLMTIGFAGVFAGVVVLFGRSFLATQITNSLTTDAALRPAIRTTIGVATELLVEVAGAVIFIGVVVIAAALFAGPARAARTAREWIAPFMRERPVASYAITLWLLALVFVWRPIPATGTPAGIIVFTLLALLGTEVLRRQTAREFPDARPGAAAQAVRTRWSRRRDRRQAVGVTSGGMGAATTAEQLRQLSQLRDGGAITSDEYQTAKAQLLTS